ncbi:MAG: ubiquitin family protein [Bacteroidota bacterium]
MLTQHIYQNIAMLQRLSRSTTFYLLSCLLLSYSRDSMEAAPLTLKVIGTHINGGGPPLVLNDLSPDTTILALKQKISESQDIPVNQQRLFYNARELDNHNQTLEGYGFEGEVFINCAKMIQTRSKIKDLFDFDKIQGICFLIFIFSFFLYLIQKEGLFKKSHRSSQDSLVRRIPKK